MPFSYVLSLLLSTYNKMTHGVARCSNEKLDRFSCKLDHLLCIFRASTKFRSIEFHQNRRWGKKSWAIDGFGANWITFVWVFFSVYKFSVVRRARVVSPPPSVAVFFWSLRILKNFQVIKLHMETQNIQMCGVRPIDKTKRSMPVSSLLCLQLMKRPIFLVVDSK